MYVGAVSVTWGSGSEATEGAGACGTVVDGGEGGGGATGGEGTSSEPLSAAGCGCGGGSATGELLLDAAAPAEAAGGGGNSSGGTFGGMGSPCGAGSFGAKRQPFILVCGGVSVGCPVSESVIRAPCLHRKQFHHASCGRFTCRP